MKTWAFVVLACAGVIGCGGGGGESTTEKPLTAHVLPLQRISLHGIAPADSEDGFIRYEAEHFAYEVPVVANEPLVATAPIYVAKDGTLGSGKVRAYWVPSPSPDGPSIYAGNEKMPAPRADAIDLKLELSVAALPNFAYNGPPGVLIRAFTQGNLSTLESAYGSLFTGGVGAAVKASSMQQRADSATALRQALAALERVQDTGDAEPLGSVSVPGGEVEAELSREALRIADRLVAGFLIAQRVGTWRINEVRSAHHDLAMTQHALGLDFESEATSWFPSMTDEIASSVLEHASSLSSFVSHATAVVAIAGGLGLVSATAVTATAVVGAVAYCALTYAPAATATVIRAAGNLVRGDGSLQDYAYDTVAPGITHIVKQNLSYALGELEDRFAPWMNTGSKLGNALGKVASTLSDWTDDAADAISPWLVACVHDSSQCFRPAAQNQGNTGQNGGPVNQVGECNQSQVAGGDTPETRTFDVGTSCGNLTLNFDTYSIADAITVQYEGVTIVDTGCVGASNSLPINICGSSSQVIVSVQPNCAGTSGTGWEFTLICP